LLDGFLGSIDDGFAVLALEGEPGIGKTTVWREGMRRAEARGLLALSCRPAQSEARLSFVGLGDLLGPVPNAALSALPDPQRAALEVALLRARAGEKLRPDRRTIGVALLALLRELAASRPVLLAVDDAQWLDHPSAAALEFVARRLGREPIRVLSSVRLTDEPAETFDRVAGERRRVVRIGPLSIGALHELIKERLGRSFARPTMIKIGRLSEGNPFYAMELARAIPEVGEPRAGEPLRVPDDLGKLVRARLRRLPPESLRALLMASALSAPNLKLIDRDALVAAERADIARATGDGRVEFMHPLFASAVYSSASVAERREIHRGLAELVDDAEERARHLALGADHPDEAVAHSLELGAREARSRGAWESAAELIEQARELTPPTNPEQKAARTLAAAEDHIRAGDRPRARALFEELLAEPLSRAMRSDALRLLAQTSYHDHSFVEARRLFAEALECADDPRRELAIEFGLVFIDSELLDFASASTHAYRAAELAGTVDDPPLQGLALGDCAMMDFFCGRGVDWEKVTRSLELESPHPLVPLVRCPTMLAGLLMLFVGRLSEARERLLTVWARCNEQGEENDLAFIVLWLGWLEVHRGDFVAAKQLVDEGATLAVLTGAATMHGWALSQRAYLLALSGEVAGARRCGEEALALSQRYGYAVPMVWVAAALATLELSRGDAEGAWRACEPLTTGLEYAGIGEPTTVFFLPDALEALIALGELDRAERLLGMLERRSRELDRAWTLAAGGRCRGLLLAARADVPAAVGAFDRALGEHDRVEMPFERARTLLCLGRVERRAKQRKAAREALSEAFEIFDRVGARLWAELARHELDRTHVREAPLDLTPSEEQVAQLAARGLKNREIAERLFLSPKTVEANLARAYRKLGIRSRAELGAVMGTQAPSRSS
jgi:DNA-binding CsgD family transcriptional regulator